MANNLNIVGTTAAGGASGMGLAWFAPGNTAGPVAIAYTAEVQTVTITGTPTGGTFTLTWRGLTTAAIAYNATTAAVATALNTAFAAYLPAGGVITVPSGTPGTSYVVNFPAGLGNVAAMTATGSFTGGTTPTISVAETTPGVGANPATALIPASFKDAGECDPSGLVMKVADSSKDILAFGSLQVQRTLFTQSKQTFDVLFLETNHTTLEIYHRLPIGTTGTANMDGYIPGVVDGPPNIVNYAGIFDIVDGLNHLRAYCPLLLNTNRGDMNMPFGEAIKRPVTFTAFPDSLGNSVYWYPVVNALAGL